MNFGRYVLRRLAWTGLGALIILTGAFLLFAYTPDPQLAFVRWANANNATAQEQAVNAYQAARNYNEPLLQRYVTWMLSYITLDLGTTLNGRPVIDVLVESGTVTLVYLVPGILLGNILGILAGHLAAMRGGIADAITSTLSYVGLGIPAFFLGEVTILVFIRKLSWYRTYYDTRFGLWSADNLVTLTLPALVVALNIFAVQMRYSRAETLEFVSADFVKTLRANGAGFRDRSKHVLRNASLPLISLFFTETLTILFITVYVVELVFRVPGLGQVAFAALNNRDFALILATTLIPVFIGLVGNLIQDIAYAVLDPRIDSSE